MSVQTPPEGMVVISAPVVTTARSTTSDDASVNQVTSGGPILPAPVPRLTAWKKIHERRFRELGRREALGTIAADESLELEDLAQARRDLVFPRSADQIIAEIRRRDAVAKLVQAIHLCAQVLPANPDGDASGADVRQPSASVRIRPPAA